ncbi:coil containing protein [Vibrio phage 1.138.O._10N.261.48.A1]|nr:coil containing protein [Vibrio phage 1.138.O._10N.261.48.A1]
MTVETIVSAPLGVAGEYPSHDNKLGLGGVHVFTNIKERDLMWATLKDKNTVALVGSGENNYPSWYKWESGKWHFSGYFGGMVLADVDGALTHVDSTAVLGADFEIQSAGDTGKGVLLMLSAAVKAEIAKKAGAGAITIRSQKDTIAGVGQLTIAEGLELVPDKDDKTKALIRVDPAFFFAGKPSAYLAGLKKNIAITALNPDGVIFFDKPMTQAGEGIEVNKGSYGIQDPTMDDPNVTGGTPTEILSTIGFIGNAPESGRIMFSVKVKRMGESEKFLTNPNGKVIVYEREVTLGQKLKPMFLAGIVQAKGVEYIRLHVSHNFKASELVIDHTKSFLCFQQLVNGWQSSVARNAFEQKAGVVFTPEIERFGADIISAADELKTDTAMISGSAGDSFEDLDLLGFNTLAPVSAGIVNGNFTATSSGSDIADFMLDMAADNYNTKLLRGHNVTFDIELVDKNSGWNFDLYAWTGEADKPTQLYGSRNNQAINVNANLTKIATTFISEDIVSGAHRASVSGVIPDDANNIIAVVYPVEAQNPLTLKVASMAMSSDPFTAYAETMPELASERHLHLSESYARFIQNTQGFAALRYTYNAKEQPAPTGKQFRGNAPITIDSSINSIAGSQAKGGEGAYKFGFDGIVEVSTSVSASNETNSDTTMSLFFRSVDIDGALGGEIPDSKVTFTVKAGDKNIEHSLPAFEITVQEGYRVAPRITESAKDGGYLECDSDRQPLIETTFDIKKLI